MRAGSAADAADGGQIRDDKCTACGAPLDKKCNERRHENTFPHFKRNIRPFWISPYWGAVDAAITLRVHGSSIQEADPRRGMVGFGVGWNACRATEAIRRGYRSPVQCVLLAGLGSSNVSDRSSNGLGHLICYVAPGEDLSVIEDWPAFHFVSTNTEKV